MDKKQTIVDILNEWADLHGHTNLEPLLDYYKIKYDGVKIIDYAIEGNTIFITPEGDLDVLKISFKVVDKD